MLTTVELAVQGCVIIMCVGGASHYTRSICIDEHHYGHKKYVAIIERWPQKQRFLSTIPNGDVAGTKVSGHYSEGGHTSGMAKRGPTIVHLK